MVKKNLVNKNVVRALSIGLSLAMASQPLTAMAAGETSDTPTTDPVEGSPVAGPADDAKEEKPATQAAEVMGEAVDFKDTIKPVGDAIKETNDAIDAVNSANAQAPLQIELGVNKEAADLSWEADSNFNHISDVAEKDLALTGDLFGAAAQDFIKDNLEPQVEDKVDARNKTLTNEEKTGVNDIVDKADALLDGTEEKLTAAEQQLETSKDIIANTSDPAVAGPAYEAAKQKVEEANSAVNKAETDLAQLESDYAKAEEDFNDADEEYRTLKGQYENAYNAYISYVNAAGRDAQSLDRELERLEKEANDLYKAANAAKGRVDAAKAWVDQAKAATEAQKKALEKQKEELQKSKYAELKALEDKLNARVDDNYTTVNFFGTATEHNQENDPTFGDKTGVQKDTYDEYFDKVIELYYIPEVIKGKFVSLKWNKNNTNNDIYNYCDVTYQVVENGETVTKTVKLNYKLKESNNRHEFGGLVIFEKTEHDYINGADLTPADVQVLEEGGIITLKDGKQIKKVDGKYVTFTNNATPDFTVTDSNTRVNGQGAGKVVDVDEDSEKQIEWSYKYGTLTKIVKQKVTTTEYTGASLDAVSAENSSYTDENDAKDKFAEELNKALDNLTVGDSIEITVGTVVKRITKTADKTFEVKTGDTKTTVAGDVVSRTNAADFGYEKDFYDHEAQIDGYTVTGNFTKTIVDSKVVTSDWERSTRDANADYRDKASEWINSHSYKVTQNIGDGSLIDTRNVDDYIWVIVPIKVGDHDEYKYSGTASVEYKEHVAKYYNAGFINNGVANFVELWRSIWGSELDEDDAKKYLGADELKGKEFLDLYAIDNRYGLTLVYQPIYSVDSTQVFASNDASSIEAAINATLASNQRAHLSAGWIATAHVSQPAYTTYGYKQLNYLTVSESVDENAVVSKTTWTSNPFSLSRNRVLADTSKVDQRFENDKWYSGDISFATTYKHGEADYKTDANTDSEKRFTYKQQDLVIKYRKALADQQAKIDRKDQQIRDAQNKINAQDAESKRLANLSKLYAKISKEAKQAEKAADKAEKRIAEIKLMIDNLDRSRHDFEAELIEKKAWLEDAQQRLDAAIQRRNDLLDALKEITLPTGGGEGGGEPGGDEGTGTGTGAPAIGGVIPGPVLLGGAAPAGFIGGGGAPAAAGEGDGTVELTNGQAALAATVPEETTEQPQLADIKTPDAPLAAAPINEETLSWWWLLIIAVLGGAGYAMYKKFQTKKDEKTTN